MVAGGGLTSLALDLEAPQDDGHLVAVVADDVTTPVPSDPVLTDPGFLRAYTTSRQFVAHRADPSAQLTVQVRLGEPVRVVAVPPSALYGLDGTAACLLADGVPLPVEVVASELGQSLVSADPSPARVQIDAGQDSAPCR
ncbi:hypothetical protein LEP48_01055 [Isoptericola sp. NEAU-Y5]|uniref:Peptidylprolyl isomerase n=1 Tax=Isoptericola luteus TaxID=2879484 RepID=A0ABS7ZA60_9MICO|nr:hypothetical protein [Isoptericola sp. NEAU-Y5]MCA5891938.1 hypothetical protein [Isoptericola sp. NEAU-Y5]